MLNNILLLVAIFNLVITGATAASLNIGRGKLLHENHCRQCHESYVHIRANHKAHSLSDVHHEVLRWSEELRLEWSSREMKDIAHYLYLSFYAKNAKAGDDIMSLTLTSTAFSHNDNIPSRYGCDGEDVSPGLSWSGIPSNSKSLALIVDDPDAPDPAAPKMTWVHWVLYNLPADSEGLREAMTTDALPEGTLSGINDWKKIGYGGPCPPIGRHRYFFKLYALDIQFPDLKKPTKEQLEQVMQGHVLEKAELIGTYQR